MEKTFLTEEGHYKLQLELKRLKGVEMKEVLQSMTDARDKGDISENTEFDVAKEQFDLLSIKIKNIENKLANCVILNKDSVNTSSVQVLTTVKVFNKKTNKENIFTIVPEDEPNIKDGKISFNSPVGKSLINKIVGDIVSVNIPNGLMELEILDINL